MTVLPATWCSLLTPPSTGAIAVIRLAGPESGRMIQQVFRLAGRRSCADWTDGEHLQFGQVVDEGGTVDDVLVGRVGRMDVPTFDISAHGGVRVVERILQVFERAGARIEDSVPQNSSAWPADSLVEAEAIDALAQAKTERAVRFLAWQRRHLVPWLDQVASACLTDPGAVQDHLTAMIARAKAAQDLIEGVTVVLIGPPNSGKSTLFNRLVGRGAAVVSPTEGTTLDWVSAPLEIDGLPVTLADTAGTDGDLAEPELQVAAALGQSGTSALLCVVVFDESQPPPPLGRWVSARGQLPCEPLIVANKADLRQGDEMSAPEVMPALSDGREALRISAKTGQGIELLTGKIVRRFGLDRAVDTTPCLFTTRQRGGAREALEAASGSPALAARIIRNRIIGRKTSDGEC